MEEVNKVIRERHQHLLIKQQMPELLEKARGVKGNEGDISPDGKKVFRGGKWVPRNSKEKRSAPVSGKKSPIPAIAPAATPAEDTTHTPSNKEMASLKFVKKLVGTKDYAKAFEYADALSEESQNIIPQDIWNKMTEAKDKQKEIDEKAEAKSKQGDMKTPSK